jgi:hypothetical protein
MQFFLWQNWILRMDFGEWIVNMGRNGILLTSHCRKRGNQFYWLCQHCCRWAGLNPLVTFCAATETARDVATEYIEAPVNSLQPHKFHKYVVGDMEYETLPESHNGDNGFLYMVEVYVNDFMSLIIPVSREQLRHVLAAIMTGIHDVFPPDADDGNDPISEKKLRAQEGLYSTRKTLLGFDFNGKAKTIWLKATKGKKL